jgi:hypothetical protein
MPDDLTIFVAAILLGLIPAAIAKAKGASFIGFWAFGALLFIVALPVAIFLKREYSEGMMGCPVCKKSVSKAAASCPSCGHPIASPMPL